MQAALSRRGVAGARVARAAPVVTRRSLVISRAGSAGPVNDNTFQELVLNAKVPVLVDFWAPWCGPCRMIAPIVDEIAGEFSGKLTCYKLNTDESPGIATEYGIRSIPTIMIFKGGQKMETIIGAVPKSTIVQSIEKYT